MKNPPSILYVDDEVPLLTLFEAVFEDDFEIHTAPSAYEALEILRSERIQLLITDQRMPEMTGVELLEAIGNEFPDMGRMILTAYLDVDAIIRAINGGRLDHYVNKPWEEDELRAAIDQVLETYRRRASRHQRTAQLESELARERQLREAFQKYVPDDVLKELLEP